MKRKWRARLVKSGVWLFLPVVVSAAIGDLLATLVWALIFDDEDSPKS